VAIVSCSWVRGDYERFVLSLPSHIHTALKADIICIYIQLRPKARGRGVLRRALVVIQRPDRLASSRSRPQSRFAVNSARAGPHLQRVGCVTRCSWCSQAAAKPPSRSAGVHRHAFVACRGQLDLVLSHCSKGTHSQGGGPQVCWK
jgi:hypothetical protein